MLRNIGSNGPRPNNLANMPMVNMAAMAIVKAIRLCSALLGSLGEAILGFFLLFGSRRALENLEESCRLCSIIYLSCSSPRLG